VSVVPPDVSGSRARPGAFDVPRPLCECHGEPKLKSGWAGERQLWRCPVQRRASTRASQVRIMADPERRADHEDRVSRWAPKSRDPERERASHARRRARKAGAAVADFDDRRHRDALLAEFGDRCVYCGSRWPDLTLDHDVPLAWGGDHTWRNLVPACRSCNSAKRDHVDGAGFVLRMLPRLFDRADDRAAMKRRRPAPEIPARGSGRRKVGNR